LLDISLSQVNYIKIFLRTSQIGLLTQPEDPYHPAFEVSIDTGAV